MSTVAAQIGEIEGFDVRFLDGDGDASRRRVDDYPFKRAARGGWTVARWRDTRFATIYPNFDVEVLKPDGSVAHGKTLLDTLRAAWVDAEDDTSEPDEELDSEPETRARPRHRAAKRPGRGRRTGMTGRPREVRPARRARRRTLRCGVWRRLTSYEATAEVLIVVAGIFWLLIAALIKVAPRLPGAQRATGDTVGRLVAGHEKELGQGLVIDCVFVVTYVALGALVFSRSSFTRRSNNRVRRPPGAFVGLGLLLAAGGADLVEDGILAVVVHRHGSVDTVVLAAMRVAGSAKWLFLAATFMALLVLYITRPRAPYEVGLSTNRPNFESKDEHAWDPPLPKSDGAAGRTGVCLSGGGIRSAAFSLGGMQALQDARVLERAEYLAAASGGGYLAAGWALSHAQTGEDKAGSHKPWSPGSPEERWFRDHSSYIVPDFIGGVRGVGRVLSGLAVNIVLIWVVLFVIARPVGWVIAAVHPELRAVEPVALPRDPTGEMAIGRKVTPAGTLDAVVDGAAITAQRYQVDLVAAKPKQSDDSSKPEDRSPNEVCFDTEPFNPTDRDHCFAVVQAQPITVEIRGGKAAVVSQPEVTASSPTCMPKVDPLPKKLRADRSKTCQVFDHLEVLKRPNISVKEDTFTGVDRLPDQLNVADQPLLRTRTGLVGRPELAISGGMWQATFVPLAVAALIGLLLMCLRIRGEKYEAGRFTAMTFSFIGYIAFAVTIGLPALILWEPEATGNLSIRSSSIFDYLLPSGGLLIVASATVRQYLSSNRAGKGTGPAKPSQAEPPAGILSRIRAKLTQGREQLGWYEWSPLKVLLGLLLLASFLVFFVTQLQYAVANGPTGTLMGLPFVRSQLPHWLWWRDWWRWGVGVGLLAWFAFAVDAHAWSLYPYYKRALTSAYLLQRSKADTCKPMDYQEPLSMSKWLPHREGQPKLILCCAVNLSEYGVVPPGRRAASFTFGPDYVGGPLVGYQKYQDYWKSLPERRQRDITLPSAMAISGAAFSPAMGKTNLGPMGCVLAVANLRLGVWLPHPQRATSKKSARPGWRARRAWGWFARPGWLWFLREVTNTYKFQRRYLYVSDGGHWENLGLVELLRRGCTEIICISAAGDGATGFGTLSEAMALAREELGVTWEQLDPTPLRAPITTRERPPMRELRRPGATDTAQLFAPASFTNGTYRFSTGIRGRLVFIETDLTADMPFDVHGFAESAAIFPEDATADQIFSHRQFEAFRALGYHQVAAAFPAATGS